MLGRVRVSNPGTKRPVLLKLLSAGAAPLPPGLDNLELTEQDKLLWPTDEKRLMAIARM